MNNRLIELYKSEEGKLLLAFGDDRFNEYVDIIHNTKEYREIMETIPNDFTNLEKAYYIYNKLGILLHENNSLVYNHMENLNMYYGTIRNGGIGNCRQMSELFVTMLSCADVIENFYLTRKPVGVEQLDLRHIDAIIQIDGNLYMTDIIRDTVNMRAGIKNMKFGYVDTREKRVDELKKYISLNNSLSEEDKEEIILLLDNEQYNDFLAYIENLKNKKGIDLGVEFFRRKLHKIEFSLQIREEIGELTGIPKSEAEGHPSIEYLDKRINNIRNYSNIGFPHNLNIENYHYFEDILTQEIIPKMRQNDSDIRRSWSYSKNIFPDNSLDENLEMDIDILLDVFYTISPEMDSEICLKYLKYAIEKIYSEREYGSVVDREWINKHIKICKTIDESDIENKKELFPLQTFLVLRKSKPQKEKYVFYRMEEDKKPKKLKYDVIIEEMKTKKSKICSKFSNNRKNAVEEFEL